ncbi:MAG: porin, partial [Chitinophagaceae bacterium]
MKLHWLIFLLPTGIVAQDSTLDQNKKLQLSAYVEAYYGYDFNKPADNKRPSFLYNFNRANEFNINLAYIKASHISENTRLNLALAAGTYMQANYAEEPALLQFVLEANAGLRLSKKNNIWLDIGIMPSHLGFEGPISSDCWTLSRSMAAENSPYFQTGARLGFTSKNEKWNFAVLALNGWQNITRKDNFSLINWGTQLQYKPGKEVILNYSTFIGTVFPDSARRMRYFHNLYAILPLTTKWGLIIGTDIGQEQSSANDASLKTWYSPQAIIRYKPSPKMAVAMRGEYYNDPNGLVINFALPGEFKATGLSINLDYIPFHQTFVRIEGRWLKNQTAVFPKDGSFSENNFSLLCSVSVRL